MSKSIPVTEISTILNPMLAAKSFLRNKFTRIEILFFFVYFFLFNIVTDLEYNLYERHHAALFIKDIPSRLVYGIIYLIPFAIYYKGLLWGLLFKKRYRMFFGSLAAFLVALNFYLLYSYWVISKLPFLPADIRGGADTFYHAKVVMHFSVMYIFRELIVISCLAYVIKSVKQEQLINAIRQEQLQAELKYLKVQLQPHFFFNTLNNIYALTLERSAAAAPLVAQHSEMMRYILYNSASRKVPLEEEVSFLQNYSQVEAVRYGEKISISFDQQGIPGPATTAPLTIEPLLLLPFIENAFKHGAREETRAGYIRVVLCVIENELTLEVMNSRPSEKRSRTEGEGIGLKNVEKRLSLLYPGKHRVEINETETDYEIRLTLQLDANG